MTLTDTLIVALWLLLTLGLGVIAGLRANAVGFWLNNRNTPLLLLVATIVATQVGGGTVLGITASTYESGIGFGLVAIASTIAGFVALAALSPRIKEISARTKAMTMCDILGQRFGRSVHVASGLLVLFAYLAMLAGQIVAGTHIVTVLTDLEPKLAGGIVAAFVVAYTAFAGLRGDVLTDVLHLAGMAVLMFGIAVSVSGQFGFGLELDALDPALISPLTFGGWTYLVAGLLFGAVIPLVSMEMWLRIFAASDAQTARRSFLLSAICVVPFYVLPLLLGLKAHSMGVLGPTDDALLVEIASSVLPAGLSGFALASLLAVVVSTTNTLVVALGAVVYRDILGRDPEREQGLTASRWVTLLIGTLGLTVALVVWDIVQLVLSAFFVISVLAPALAAAMFWPWINARVILVSIVGGGILTIASLPFIPKQAFLPGFLFAGTVLIVGAFSLRQRRAT